MTTRSVSTETWRKPMTAVNPFRELHRMQKRMDQFMDNFFAEPFPSTLFSAAPRMLSPFYAGEELSYIPACDLDETDSHYWVTLDLPGVKKDQLKVELKDHQLILSGERKEEHKVEKFNRINEERVYGAVYRVITLPSAIQADQVQAQFESGVLRVSIPKIEGAKPKQIPIEEPKAAKVIETKVA
jgi:HSP20 family protein